MKSISYYKSEIGILEIVVEDKTLISLKLVDKICQNYQETDFTKKIKVQLDEYFSGKRKIFNIKIAPHGTDFQKKVWLELQKVPYGVTKSYTEIAGKIGDKNYSRAVGNACNKNPIIIIIPCHRIISKRGTLSGFAYGTIIKERLLTIESYFEKVR